MPEKQTGVEVFQQIIKWIRWNLVYSFATNLQWKCAADVALLKSCGLQGGDVYPDLPWTAYKLLIIWEQLNKKMRSG